MAISSTKAAIFVGISLICGLMISCASVDLDGTTKIAPQSKQQRVLGRYEIVQLALEKRVSGDSEIFIIKNSSLFRVTPIATWKSVSGHYCRSYVEEILVGKTIEKLSDGVRCRDEYGYWKKAGE